MAATTTAAARLTTTTTTTIGYQQTKDLRRHQVLLGPSDTNVWYSNGSSTGVTLLIAPDFFLRVGVVAMMSPYCYQYYVC